MANNSPSTFSDRVRAHNLAVAWMFAAIGGAITISMSSGLSATRLVLPVLVMLVYFVYGLTQRTRNTANLADSIYFMGFLWTLYALIDALIRHGADIRPDTLFIVFGYALVTTGLGMFLRLVLIQFQPTLPDQIIETRQEIEERVAAFVGELCRAQADLATARSQATEMIAAWTRELADTTGRLQTEVERLHMESVRSVTGHLQSSVRSLSYLSETIKTADEALRTLKPTVAAIAKQATAAESRLEERIGKLGAALDAGSGELERALNELTSRITNVKVPEDVIVARIESAWSRVEPVVSRIAGGLDSMSRSAADVQAQTMTVAQAVSTLTTEFAGVTERIEELIRLLDGLKGQSVNVEARVVARSVEHLASAEQAIAEAKAMGQELQRVVSEVLTFVRRHLVEAVR